MEKSNRSRVIENLNILDEFKNDDVYRLFLTDDFDVKSITSSAVQLVAVTEHLAKLSAGVVLLDKELHNQVANHYEDLLSQATEIETLESVLRMVNAKIQNLLSSANRLRRNVVDPYIEVSSQTMMLVRLQTTCDILRRVIRVIQLCQRLENQLHGNANAIIKASQCLNEIDYLLEGIDLSGFHIMENHLQLIKRAREQIHSQADALLLNGIETQEGLDVATALQVFHNLQVLKPVVHQILQQTDENVFCNIQEALDVQRLSSQSVELQKAHGPGRVAMPLAGNTAAFRAKLWMNMENLMRNILNTFHKIQHLQAVLIKKNLVTNIDLCRELEMDGEINFVENLWEVVTQKLTSEFARAAKESTYIKQAFEVEFPKLLCLFNDFSKHLYESGCIFQKAVHNHSLEDQLLKTDVQETSDVVTGKRCARESLRFSLTPFENAYLSRCLSRLTDSVNVICAGEGQSAPTVEDVGGIIKAIKSELSAASIDPVLLNSVAKNVADTIVAFVEKCQFLVSTDDESMQVNDLPNPSQLLNAQVAHLLHLLVQQLNDILEEGNFSNECIDVLKDSSQSAHSLMKIIVKPLFNSVSSSIHEILLKMHTEDFSSNISDKKIPEAPCSQYMIELQKFFSRCQNDFLVLYPDCDIINYCMHDVASHCIELFVLLASLVRPLGDGGKMRLAADCAQMEMVLTTWCQKIGDLGRPYRLLRAFRPLLFQTANHIAQSPAVKDIVPYSIALHLLIARAPCELELPHEVAGWSLKEYACRLDFNSSEKERLFLIKNSLEKYVLWVKQRQDKEFCSVYPVLVDLLQQGLHDIS